MAGDEVDPVYFESSYYVAPEDKTAKPYVLFSAALRETGYNAIAKVAMHNHEHIVLIRPANDGLLLHTLFYPNELHTGNKVAPPAAKYTAGELDLAKQLVTKLAGPFRPKEFHDAYRESVERLIAQKSKGHKITPVKQPRPAPVVDLMESLKKSLASHGAPAKGTRKASTGAKSSRRRAA